jgi:hypothetical protein
MMFSGFVAIGTPIRIPVLVDIEGLPVNADSLPIYRVYGDQGLLPGGTGSCVIKDSLGITGATNASPIVIASVGHNLQTGMKVTISGVVGNTAANGTWTITVIDPNTFSLNGSAGNGAYTSGGTWNTSGLYDVVLTPTTGSGYAQGLFYDILITALVSGVPQTSIARLGVV